MSVIRNTELLAYVCPSSTNLTLGAKGLKFCYSSIPITTCISCVPGGGVEQLGGDEVTGQSGQLGQFVQVSGQD